MNTVKNLLRLALIYAVTFVLMIAVPFAVVALTGSDDLGIVAMIAVVTAGIYLFFRTAFLAR